MRREQGGLRPENWQICPEQVECCRSVVKCSLERKALHSEYLTIPPEDVLSLENILSKN